MGPFCYLFQYCLYHGEYGVDFSHYRYQMGWFLFTRRPAHRQNDNEENGNNQQNPVQREENQQQQQQQENNIEQVLVPFCIYPQ